jgi:hypothetical protein
MSIPLLCLILAGAAALSIGFFWAIHRLVGRDTFLDSAPRHAPILAIVGTSFAVILAFVISYSLGNFNNAKTAAASEAVSVIETVRVARLLPAAERTEIQGLMVCYGRAVIYKEWPLMEQGKTSPLVDDWIDKLWGVYAQVPVRTLKDQAIYTDLLQLQVDRNDARRDRETTATASVPSPVWFVLILGGALTIAFVLLFKDRAESFALQAAMIAGVTVMVVAVLAVVWFLGHPYRNSSGSIKPTQMQLTLKRIGQVDRPQVPCTAQGVPTTA